MIARDIGHGRILLNEPYMGPNLFENCEVFVKTATQYVHFWMDFWIQTRFNILNKSCFTQDYSNVSSVSFQDNYNCHELVFAVSIYEKKLACLPH